MRTIFKKILACYFFFCAIILSAENSDSACTALADIQKKGKLVIGTYNDVPYFSFLNPFTYQLEGFDIDLAHALAQEILGDPNKVQFVAVVPEERVPFIEKGKVDLVIAQMSVNKERSQKVFFSDVYYIAGQSLLVKANSSFRTPDDLSYKSVGVLKGTTNISKLKEKIPNPKLVYFDTSSSALQALSQEQIHALYFDDVLLSASKTNSHNFLEGYRFIGGEIFLEAYAIAVKYGCSELLHAVNRALIKIKSDGRWQTFYDKNIGFVSGVSARPPEG